MRVALGDSCLETENDMEDRSTGESKNQCGSYENPFILRCSGPPCQILPF